MESRLHACPQGTKSVCLARASLRRSPLHLTIVSRVRLAWPVLNHPLDARRCLEIKSNQNDSAFEERGMDSLAQAWTNKMPSLDAPSDETFDASSPAAAAAAAAAADLTREQGNGSGGVVRARRVAQDRGRYTGFDDGRFKAIRESTRRGENPGGGVGRFSYGSAGGGGGGYSGGGGAGGSARGGGRGTGGATAGSGREERVVGGGGSPSSEGGGGGGWAQRYTKKSGDEK